MADHPLVVEAKGWPQPPHLARRSYIHRRSVIQLLFGFVVLGFATALLYGFSMRGDVAWIVFAVAFVGLAVVLIGANVRTLGRIHLIPEDRRVPITLPYAFAIDGDELMTSLDMPPGPSIGALLDRLLEIVVADPMLNDRSRLLTLARELVAPGIAPLGPGDNGPTDGTGPG